jgi:hypothetical protein
VSEKPKLIRGDPPKIDFKKKGEPPNKKKLPDPGELLNLLELSLMPKLLVC